MTGQKIGYARVSTTGQNTMIQVEQLKNVGCHKIYEEKATGTTKNRTQLIEMLNYIRSGDTLIVTRIDRLARSIRDLQNLIHELKEKGVTIKATEQPIDTGTAAGKAFLDMLGVFAEFETNIRKERQMEGIAKAKAKGVYKGRKPLSEELKKEIQQLIQDGVRPTEIAKTLKVGRTSIYMLAKQLK